MPSSTHSFNGPQSFLRSAYPPDTIEVLRPSHTYTGKITEAGSNSKCLDNAVCITGVDDKTRAAALAYFNSCNQNAVEAQQHHGSEKNKGIAATVIGVSAGLGGCIGLAASLVAPPIAAPMIIFGLATTIFGAHQTSHNQKIIRNLEDDSSAFLAQRELWKDPLHRVIEQRQLAGAQGFSYVFNNNLKNTIIHPEEAKSLWIRDFSRMLLSPQTTDAFSADLLGKTKMEYAWDGSPLHDLEIKNRKIPVSVLETMTARYQECREDYQRFKAKINKEIRDLDNHHQSLKQAISNQRNLWLQPAHHLYNEGIQEAQILYNQAIEQFIRERDFAIAEVEQEYNNALRCCTDTLEAREHIRAIRRDAIATIHRDYERHPAIIAITEAHRRDRLMCSFLFDQSKSLVDAFFDQRIHQLEIETTHARQQIEQQRVDGECYFSHELNQILQGNFRFLRFTPPSVRRKWELSNFGLEPAWNDVYGRVPRFQTTFATTLTEDAWNLFWGNRGLGSFASSPISSWSRVSSNGTRFPFKQRWFNLHTIPHEPRRRMFCQRVVFPTQPTRIVPEATKRTSFAETRRREETQAPKRNVRETPKTGFANTRRR